MSALTELFILLLCGTSLGCLGTFLHKINLLVGFEGFGCLVAGEGARDSYEDIYLFLQQGSFVVLGLS